MQTDTDNQTVSRQPSATIWPPLLNDGEQGVEVALAQRLAILQDYFPGKSLSVSAAEIYITELVKVCRQVGIDVLDSALTGCIQECTFMPTVAEIRNRAGMNKERADEAAGQQAWMVVLNYISKHGTDNHPVMRNRQLVYPPQLPERIRYAVRIAGGLKAIEDTPDSQIHFRRKDFEDAYKAYEYVQEFPLRLPDGLRDLLPVVARAKALPSLNAVSSALEEVQQATDEADVIRLRKKIDEARVRFKPAPAPAMTDAELEARARHLRRQAAELQQRYSPGEHAAAAEDVAG
ncbi:MAG: hypothetical protein LAP21_23980 [Acidobacteriia bacterium]|nr:hypothetical protein [Terriglobia bacterium]